MPYAAKRFNQRRLPLVIEIDGDAIHLEYHPFFFTPERADELQRWDQVQTSAEFLEHVVDAFLSLVVAWDVVYEEGDSAPIALTRESLLGKPDLVMFELAIMKRIKEEVNLGEALNTSQHLNGKSPALSGAKRRH